MSNEITPAIERVTDVLIEHRDLVCVTGDPDVVAYDLLDHALSVDEIATVAALHHMKGGAGNPTCVCSWEPDWTAGPWIPQFDAHLANQIRAALLGTTP